MADIKISELEPTTDLEGLYTIGSDKNNLSKKVSLQFLKDAANYANEQGDYAKQAGDTVNGNVGVSDYPEFSASKSYVIGDIVRYNGVLYAFTANHAASAWNGSDVKATSINAITIGKLTELESERVADMGFDLKGTLKAFEKWFTAIREVQFVFAEDKQYGVAYLGVLNGLFTMQLWNQTDNVSAGTFQYNIADLSGTMPISGNFGNNAISMLLNIDLLPTESASTTTIAYQPKIRVYSIANAGHERGDSFVNYLHAPLDRIYCSLYQDYSISEDSDMKIAQHSISFRNVVSNPATSDMRFYFHKDFAQKHIGQKLYIAIEVIAETNAQMSVFVGSNRLVEYTLPVGYSFIEQSIILPNAISENEDFILLWQKPIKVGAVYCNARPVSEGIADELAFSAISNSEIQESGNSKGADYTEFNGFKSYDSNLSAGNALSTFGFFNTIDRDLVLKGVQLDLQANKGAEIDLMLGMIDQRGLFILREKVQYVVDDIDIDHRSVILVPKTEPSILYKEEVIFLDCKNYKWGYSTSSSVVDNPYPLYFLMADGTTPSKANGYNLSSFKLIVSEYAATPFFSKKEGNQIQNQVMGLAEQVALSKVLKDIVTGEQYKLIVANGTLEVKLLQYKNILIIGNSFTNHGASEGIWYQSRGMASSKEGLDYKSLLEAGLGEGVSIQNVVALPFEKNYSENFDYSLLNLPDGEFDLVICQMGENGAYNSTMQNSWINLYKHLKNKYHAELLQIIGWKTADKYAAISAACKAADVPLIDCNTETYTGNFRSGDYVTTTSLSEFDIIVPAVRTHPSDVGMLLIANKLLSHLGKSQLDMMRKINLVQTSGGVISTNYISGVVGGVISIKCEPSEGKSIASLSVETTGGVAITPTYKENQYGKYYIFFMPNEDVMVTASFV